MNGLALCAGIGGLELGLKRAMPEYRTICYVERDPYAAGVLAARMEEKAICAAPIWDDLKSFDGRRWRGIVDLVTAGFPCQPFSAAGQRKGTTDERWIWPEIARIIAEVDPAYLFLENVPGFVSLGLEFVLRDLAALGFDARWCCVPASAAGAPHKRDRFFLLAHTTNHRLGWREQLEGRRKKAGKMADADRQGRQDVSGRAARPGSGGSGTPGSASWWESEPDVGRVANGVPFRVDRIRCLGNAVVPAQAELAWRILTS